MTSLQLDRLIEMLRDELLAYGELLALLQEQQTLIIARSSGGLLSNVNQIDAQFQCVAVLRQNREEQQERVGISLPPPPARLLREIASRLTHPSPLMDLVSEINSVLRRIHIWLRQNQRLLQRSVDLTQQFMGAICRGRPSVRSALRRARVRSCGAASTPFPSRR